MNERDRLCLRHVLDAIDAIENFTIEGRDSLMSGRRTQSAVVRQIEIIGDLTSDRAQQFGVIPAEAGIQRLRGESPWVPAFAGTTRRSAADRLLKVAEHRR
jgi:hypothetical protein